MRFSQISSNSPQNIFFLFHRYNVDGHENDWTAERVSALDAGSQYEEKKQKTMSKVIQSTGMNWHSQDLLKECSFAIFSKEIFDFVNFAILKSLTLADFRFSDP